MKIFLIILVVIVILVFLIKRSGGGNDAYLTPSEAQNPDFDHMDKRVVMSITYQLQGKNEVDNAEFLCSMGVPVQTAAEIAAFVKNSIDASRKEKA